jgi:23S rRNA (adenine2030-N6)-methyltransferase
MNYRHSFHAGNFADVFKHSILLQLLESLQHKDKAFCYVDGHGGRGLYDLEGEDAMRTQEFRDGIGRIWDAPAPPAPVTALLATVRALNPDKNLRYYPGSPRLARTMLRPQDRLLALELHAQEYALLATAFRGDAQVKIYHQDVWQGLRAHLPPPQRRGLVLLDAPFEQADEFARLVEGVRQARKRWATAIYALWYPIKEAAPVAGFYRQLRALEVEILGAELYLQPATNPYFLNGCGMAIINPPWRLDSHLQTLLPWLAQALRRDQPPRWRVFNGQD